MSIEFSYEEKVDRFFNEIDEIIADKISIVSIKKENDELNISTPYDADYVKEIKKLGGKYNPNDRTWTVKSSEEEKVKELVQNKFGEPRENIINKEFKTNQGLGIRIGEYDRKDDTYTVNYHNIINKKRGFASGIKYSTLMKYLNKNKLDLSESGTIIKKIKKDTK